MCGINGFNFNDEGLIRKMVAKTSYRGPDDSGVFIDQGISLGHNRLAVIDLSPAGRQPMQSQDGYLTIVYNGEIYNFRELRDELEKKGHKFRSRSDTEVILEAYGEYGRDCVRLFNGIFAFAIWDKRKQELFFARDQIGVKPLYYFFDGKRFIFSSEIKAILQHPVPREIDPVSLNLFFRLLYIKSPKTIFRGITSLDPGSCGLLKAGNLSVEKYWRPEESSGASVADPDAAVRSAVQASVRRQLVADVPVGIFLSGGIDSTIVLGIMSEITGGKIKSFSIGFDTAFDRYNEDFRIARKTAGYYGTEHHEAVMRPHDIEELFEKAVWHMDQPVYSPTQVANLLLARLAVRSVKVVLGGDGGDELFGGYERYYYYDLAGKWRRLPRLARDNRFAKAAARLLGKSHLLERANIDDDRELYWSFMAQKEDLLSRCLAPGFNDPEAGKQYFFDSSFGGLAPASDLARRMMRLDIGTWLPEFSLSRTDRMTMAAGLEERVPLLDKELVELALRLPTSLKTDRRLQGKLILKRALGQYIPDFVLEKQKTGWFVPITKWLRGELEGWARSVLSPDYAPGSERYIDFKEAGKIFDDHLSGRRYALNTVWSLITFQAWHKQYMR